MSTTESAHCKGCRATLGSLVKRHRPDQCPLISGSYCGLCASYGHSPFNCPDTFTRAYREPHMMEQLIPAALLEEYNIRTVTPLKNCAVAALPEKEEVWEVPETEEGLRTALNNVGGKPMICQEKGKTVEKGKKESREMKENKKRLQIIADSSRAKIVYISTKLVEAPVVAAVAPVVPVVPAVPKEGGVKAALKAAAAAKKTAAKVGGNEK